MFTSFSPLLSTWFSLKWHKFAVAPQPPFDIGYQIIMVWHIAIFGMWHSWKPRTSSAGEQTKWKVTPERKERPLVFRQINFEFLLKSRMLLFWLPGTLHGLPLLQKPILGLLFTMQTFVHNGGENWLRGNVENKVMSLVFLKAFSLEWCL